MIDLQSRENALGRFEGHCRAYLLECAWTQTPEGCSSIRLCLELVDDFNLEVVPLRKA